MFAVSALTYEVTLLLWKQNNILLTVLKGFEGPLKPYPWSKHKRYTLILI